MRVHTVDRSARRSGRDVFEAKKREGIGISDPEQERLVLGRAMDFATELNLDVRAIKEVFDVLMRMSLRTSMSSSGRIRDDRRQT